jgi:hypothetical protein
MVRINPVLIYHCAAFSVETSRLNNETRIRSNIGTREKIIELECICI